MELTSYLKGIADAIRENTKQEDLIPAQEFANEISALSNRVDTSDANATAEDLPLNKTAYVNGEKIEGTARELKAGNSYTAVGGAEVTSTGIKVNKTFTDDVGYMFKPDSKIALTVSNAELREIGDITADKLIEGYNLCGVVGTVKEGIDTSDATALKTDIVSGKTAYVNGKKVTGNIYELKTNHSTADSANGGCDTESSYNNVPSLRVYYKPDSDILLRKDCRMDICLPYTDITTDAKLTSEKLVSGYTLFGVEGDNNIVNTGDATATINDIAQGQTAYVNGVKITGSLFTIKGLSADVASGAHMGTWNGKDAVRVYYIPNSDRIHRAKSQTDICIYNDVLAEAIELTPDKILTGQTVLGIEGTGGSGIDTSDADATPEDILSGKTAYVNGEKIEGTMASIEAINSQFENIDMSMAPLIQLKGSTGDYGSVIAEEAIVYMDLNQADLAEAIGLTADKIKKGETILGITGTYEGDFSETITPEEYSEAETQINDLFGEEETV